jgi:hypothetical protein
VKNSDHKVPLPQNAEDKALLAKNAPKKGQHRRKIAVTRSSGPKNSILMDSEPVPVKWKQWANTAVTGRHRRGCRGGGKGRMQKTRVYKSD